MTDADMVLVRRDDLRAVIDAACDHGIHLGIEGFDRLLAPVAVVVPPTEPPKACPTCGGRGELKYPGACRINCNRCHGSGIDGGAPA